MTTMPKRHDQLRKALLHEVYWRNGSPVRAVATAYALSRQAVQKHMKTLVAEGIVQAQGTARWRKYRLRVLAKHRAPFSLNPAFTEDVAWKFIQQHIRDLGSEEQDILHYGVTEMVNNAIDHSEGSIVDVAIRRTAISATVLVRDDGIGVFQKIADALSLTDARQSLLELSKGKFTTDPDRHTGEGIFFSSRMFDRFSIRSLDLQFIHTSRTDDWSVETEDRDFDGTRVTMNLLLPTSRSMTEVFSKYSSGPDDHRFAKTHVPLKLATFDDESLVSRSSAKRVLSRVERFDEVLLDFAKVRSIGQGFADEIFRVFVNAHPHVRLVAINANEAVTMMIQRAKAARSDTNGNLFD